MRPAFIPLSLFVALVIIFCERADATCTGIGCSCSISADDLSFGAYDPLSASNHDATGEVRVTCGALVVSITVSYTISLSSGSSGTSLARTMANGGTTLAYNLYTTPARTSIWGNGAGGTVTLSNGYSLSLLVPRTDAFPVYGRIPPAQPVGAGSYSDSLVATVTF
ncbi:spore coat U domain-containing protein [Hyphomonas oceanitis]|uniref:Csu type fimbrial protein n=1 Tax=Hyphomonas oceanitis TaxID=81033 RepID=UPI00300167FF